MDKKEQSKQRKLIATITKETKQLELHKNENANQQKHVVPPTPPTAQSKGPRKLSDDQLKKTDTGEAAQEV